MKILLCLSDNNISSGAFLCGCNLAKELQKLGHFCLVVLPWKDVKGEQYLSSLGVEYRTIRSFDWTIGINPTIESRIKSLIGIVINKVYSQVKLAHLCKKHEIEIIHLNTTWTYIGAVVSNKLSIPRVWHFRELLEEGENRKIVFEDNGYSLMEQSNACIAISRFVSEKYSKVINLRFEVIYDGVDGQKFYHPNHVPFLDNKTQMIIVGRIYRMKGQWKVLTALGRLLKQGYSYPFHLTIAGDGSAEEVNYLKKIIDEYALAKYVTLLGSSNKIDALMSNCDIVYMCSSQEAFGRVTVEGMMSGCLIIGERAGSTAEIIEDGVTGVLYNKDSIDDLINATVRTLGNKDIARKIAAKGQIYAARTFTSEINAKRIENLYNRVLSNRGASS